MIDQIHYLQTLFRAGANVPEIAWVCGYADVVDFRTYFHELHGSIPEIYFKNSKKTIRLTPEERTFLSEHLKKVRAEMVGEAPRDLLIISRVTELSRCFTPKESIIHILGITEKEIDESVRRVKGVSFEQFLQINEETTKSQLRREQVKLAKKGNHQMLTHLGESLLDQNRKKEIEMRVSIAKLIEESHKELTGVEIKSYKIESNPSDQGDQVKTLFSKDANETN